MNKYFLIVMSIFLLGCGTLYQQTAVKPSTSSLEAGKAVLISVPEDGSYGTTVYNGSGQMTVGVGSVHGRGANFFALGV
jgi:hypothetical protein